MAQPASSKEPPVAVLDANVLYSQVLSDYFVQAQSRDLITLKWSSTILDEVIRNKKRRAAERFADPAELEARLAAADRLRAYIERMYPDQILEPSERSYSSFRQLPMPDPDDRHVVATAVAAGAVYLCTQNTADFPPAVMTHVGVRQVTPDALLVEILAGHPLDMVRAHQQVIAWTPRTTHRATLEALRRAQAPMFKDAMERILTRLGDLDSRDDLAQVYAAAIAERDRARAGMPSPVMGHRRTSDLVAPRMTGRRGARGPDRRHGIGGQ